VGTGVPTPAPFCSDRYAERMNTTTNASPALRRRSLMATALLAPICSFAAAPKRALDDPANRADRADPDGARLRAVIDGPQRSAANRARDAARHPFETLRFFGLAPTQTVVEIAPGGGWYTEILAPYLRDSGRYYAALESGDGPEQVQSRARFKERLKADPARYGRVRTGVLPGAGGSAASIAPPGSADLVLTFRNIHNWIEAGELDDQLRAFHALLKPGGVLGVEEHRARAGTPLATVIRSGYVPQDFVIARAGAAGFALVATSEINANPRDTTDHPNGVWSLPPTLRGGDTDRARFLAIGESDRMTLRFVKR
jgi:predicted methyltransferase